MNQQSDREFDAIVVGAGFAGLYMLHRLRQLGLRTVVLEAADDIGGTWYWNRYPGARCDVESLDYSFSFDDALQREWRWTEKFATQAEILRYLNHVADRFDLRKDVVCRSRVTSAIYDEQANAWTVQAEAGTRYSARFCIMAVGCLSVPTVPRFNGLDDFEGAVYHTGQWPHEPVNFEGQRVGVIGTGSSGIQVIPEVARQARKLLVFLRTPHYALPAHNHIITDEQFETYKSSFPERREAARHSRIGVSNFPMPTRSALEVSEQERQKTYRCGWNRGNTGYTRVFTDLLTSEAANATASDFVRARIRERVKEPRIADLLTPSYAIGAKRLCLETGYYEAFNRDNVSLVNVKEDPIVGFTKKGLRTQGAEHELDALVLATGYDAVTGALLSMDIRNGQGEPLAQKWKEGPRTYLGLLTAGYPNLFLITGPGSPSILCNVVAAIEQHVEWIADCLASMKAAGQRRIDADATAEGEWARQVDATAAGTLLYSGNSWYLGANVEGKPRVFMPYAGGLAQYRSICDDVVRRGYEGFVLA